LLIRVISLDSLIWLLCILEVVLVSIYYGVFFDRLQLIMVCEQCFESGKGQENFVTLSVETM